MKVVILRGGAAPLRPGRAAGPVGTAQRGVMALGDNQGRWVLVNMSPAVAHQLDSDRLLDGHLGLVDGGGVRALVLTDAQIDHVGGLLSLRNGAPIDLYATPAVFERLTTSMPVLPVLQHYCGVHWRVVPVAGDRQVASFQVDGLPTLEFTAVAMRMATPPHLSRGQQHQVGDGIALAVRDLASGQRVFCAPGLPQFGADEVDWMRQADCLLVDGPEPTAPPALSRRWLAQFAGLPARHKVMLGPAGALPEGGDWAGHGITLAHDGLAIEL